MSHAAAEVANKPSADKVLAAAEPTASEEAHQLARTIMSGGSVTTSNGLFEHKVYAAPPLRSSIRDPFSNHRMPYRKKGITFGSRTVLQGSSMDTYDAGSDDEEEEIKPRKKIKQKKTTKILMSADEALICGTNNLLLNRNPDGSIIASSVSGVGTSQLAAKSTADLLRNASMNATAMPSNVGSSSGSSNLINFNSSSHASPRASSSSHHKPLTRANPFAHANLATAYDEVDGSPVLNFGYNSSSTVDGVVINSPKLFQPRKSA